jgi:hypothetical protein
VLKEMYPPNGDVPDVPARSDAQILGQIERGRPEFEDIFSEDSVNRARKQTRETALAASKCTSEARTANLRWTKL